MMQTAIFGGGCFWCTEAVFEELRGVETVMPGYTGGTVKNPTYEQVCRGDTGHVEATKIEFDPAVISYKDLLTVFFATHDPTTPNRQGNDIGPQYRSAIFYTNDDQKNAAIAFIKQLEAADPNGPPIVTEVAPFDVFYDAEDYHQQYFRKNAGAAYCQVIIEPKVEHLQKAFASLLKEKQK